MMQLCACCARITFDLAVVTINAAAAADDDNITLGEDGRGHMYTHISADPSLIRSRIIC